MYSPIRDFKVANSMCPVKTEDGPERPVPGGEDCGGDGGAAGKGPAAELIRVRADLSLSNFGAAPLLRRPAAVSVPASSGVYVSLSATPPPPGPAPKTLDATGWCTKCRRPHASWHEFYLHYYLHHVSGLVSLESLCRDCLALNPDEQQSRVHEDVHQRVGDAFKCGRCAARFLGESGLARHLADFHRPAANTAAEHPGSQQGSGRGLPPLLPPLQQLKVPPLLSPLQSPLPSRRAPVSKKVKISCHRENCGKVCGSWMAFLQHHRACHDQPYLSRNLRCTECLAVFHYEWQCSAHMERHAEVGDSFMCRECGARFVAQRSLDKHHGQFHVA